jgi:hypothetical protein
MKATVGSLVDLASMSHPELVELFPEIETNQQILRYRMEYQSFRLGYAQGAKGEVTEVTALNLPSITSGGSSGNVLGITGADSLAEELDTSFAVLREYRIAYRRHRLGQPRGASGQVEDLAKRLSISDCRLLPAAQLAEFNAQLQRWKAALERKDLSDVAGVHVHAGAGRLGLGLVLPAIVRSGRPYAVVQRPSAAWADAMQAGKAHMKLNGTLLAELLVVRNLREFEEAFAAEQKAMLVLSENQDVLCALVARTTSYSCAIGGKDLTGALAPITKAINHLAKESSGTFAADSGKPVVPLYACENDHEAVEGLAARLEGLIEVVPVLVDRVCTARDMCKDGSVDVATEEYQGELVLTPPATLDHPRPPLPFKGDNVRVPLTPEGAAFLHRKKILSVNGTHTTIAFLTLINGEVGTVGPPKGDHELLSYEIEAAAEGRAATADPVGRAVWVWIVARQLMLLYEFDETVVKHTLGITSSDGSASDMDLIDELLGSAKIAAARLSNGGDMTSRVLGGGVENRWRTRLCNVQEFLSGVTLSRLSRKLILKAGISEIELRSSVSKLVKDSKRFVMVARPRSPSPGRGRFAALPRAPRKRQESPGGGEESPGGHRGREAHSSEPRYRRPCWLLSPSERAERRSSESPQRHSSFPEVPPMPLRFLFQPSTEF